MKNGNMPAAPTTAGAALTENHRDRIDEGYIDNFKPMIGLTKREHFAAMVMQGLSSEGGRYHSPEDMAEDAVKLADALLAELEKSE